MEFINNDYKDNWTQKTSGGRPYNHGTCNKTLGGWAVYDGATNYMGKISRKGKIVCNGDSSEYKMSFLRAAKAALGL